MRTDRHPAYLLALALLAAPGFAQSAGPRRQPQKSPGVQHKPLYKGIFEPVNYPKDINLRDVFFVTPDIGWVAGEHATILKTTDGGNTWTAQVGGDPSRDEPKMGQLRFIDERHGWAIQDGPKLLRTQDGQNWDEVKGEFPRGVPVLDYAFTSPDHGILLGGNGDAFYVTNDGGGHWTSVGSCHVSVTVQGLAQTPGCHFIQLQMFSERSGIALAWWSGGPKEQLVVFHTDDAGDHWNPVVPDVSDSRYVQMFFTDPNHGVLLFTDMKTCVTADGGKTWHTLLSGKIDLGSGGIVHFADPQVGWALGHSPHNRDAYRVSFTTDGGQHWQASGDIAFPGNVLVDLPFTFPRRDRAYVIGAHGMIYRYRIVPEHYAVARMLPGPLMPAPK
jgi:photosystem II stability/assembly factor-like uncharacterized protein